MNKLKYNTEWLQNQAELLGSWNKVCKKYSISPRTIDKYKKEGVITNVIITHKISDEEQKTMQVLYDSGKSLRYLSNQFKLPISSLKFIKTRTKADANKILTRKITEQGRQKLSDTAKKSRLGGYRPHPNRGSYYNGVWFDSSWEVKVAKSLDKENIRWSRPKQGFVWNDNGNKYYPDFYLEKYEVYLDPKNSYLMKKDEEKITEAQKRNNIKVLVLSESQLDWNVIKTLL